MTDDTRPDGPEPQDPLTIGDELSAYLGAITDANEAFDASLTPEEVQEFREQEKIRAQIGAALIAHGVDLGLEESQSLGDVADDDTPDDVIFDRRYLASKIQIGLEDFRDTANNSLMAESLAKIIANRRISSEEKGAYLAVVVDLIGEEDFQAAVDTMEENGELDFAIEEELKLQALGESSQASTDLFAAVLVSRGVPFDHDDFENFCVNLTRFGYYQRTGAPDIVMEPLHRVLREQAARIGVLDLIEGDDTA